MRTMAIIGGRLQGMEACYLAAQCGIEVTLLDIDVNSPAKYLASNFILCDILNPGEDALKALQQVDLVLPTMENLPVIEKLVELSQTLGFKLAFDMDAYSISLSKNKSDQIFHHHQIPSPAYYPEGKAPYIAKPDDQSGSQGVMYFEREEDLVDFLSKTDQKLVVQEYVEGPSYSIEIIGEPGNYRVYQITKIHMAEDYDCKMVTAPCDEITKDMKKTFEEMAVEVATIINLRGIMDFEVIDYNGQLKLLEIDARLPSQTPTAVYHSSGVNLIDEIYTFFTKGDFDPMEEEKPVKYTAFEHHFYSEGRWKPVGEHIMAEGGCLHRMDGHFGSDQVITDYEPGKSQFRFTLINTEDNREKLDIKRRKVAKWLRNLQ